MDQKRDICGMFILILIFFDEGSCYNIGRDILYEPPLQDHTTSDAKPVAQTRLKPQPSLASSTSSMHCRTDYERSNTT
ncbi:hypothetical protein BDR03DRAFT_1012228 [Suillus americanus]|nr:hypothetical protein BDR03DRAFT_1012228 [Suillus americanus]